MFGFFKLTIKTNFGSKTPIEATAWVCAVSHSPPSLIPCPNLILLVSSQRGTNLPYGGRRLPMDYQATSGRQELLLVRL